jgi:hypothetical protein
MDSAKKNLKMGIASKVIILTVNSKEQVFLFQYLGIYLWINGSRYEGEFKEGSRNGNGVWVSSITEKQYDRYEGQYKDDKKHGYGIYRWKDGTIYEG